MPCVSNCSLMLAPHFPLHCGHVLCWCLQEGGAVIPAGAVVHGQLVESPILHKCSVSTSDWQSAPCLLVCLGCNKAWLLSCTPGDGKHRGLVTAAVPGQLCAA